MKEPIALPRHLLRQSINSHSSQPLSQSLSQSLSHQSLSHQSLSHQYECAYSAERPISRATAHVHVHVRVRMQHGHMHVHVKLSEDTQPPAVPALAWVRSRGRAACWRSAAASAAACWPEGADSPASCRSRSARCRRGRSCSGSTASSAAGHASVARDGEPPRLVP